MVNPDCLRGHAFVNMWAPRYRELEELGYTPIEIKGMMGKLDFVQDFVHTPEWLVSAKKLPKGYKWSDGTKFHQKGNAKNKTLGYAYTFLIIEDDLYIKDLLNHAYELYKLKKPEDWTKVKDANDLNELYELKDTRICVIKNWKNLKSHHVIYDLDDIMNPFLEKCICDFWNDNGGKMSMQEDNPLLDELAKKMFRKPCVIEENKGSDEECQI